MDIWRRSKTDEFSEENFEEINKRAFDFKGTPFHSLDDEEEDDQ